MRMRRRSWRASLMRLFSCIETSYDAAARLHINFDGETLKERLRRVVHDYNPSRLRAFA
jgi:hypothetical protein